jgi:hypothetical protein
MFSEKCPLYCKVSSPKERVWDDPESALLPTVWVTLGHISVGNLYKKIHPISCVEKKPENP